VDLEKVNEISWTEQSKFQIEVLDMVDENRSLMNAIRDKSSWEAE